MNKYTDLKQILAKQVKQDLHVWWLHLTDKNGKDLEFKQLYDTVPNNISEVYSPRQLLDKLNNVN